MLKVGAHIVTLVGGVVAANQLTDAPKLDFEKYPRTGGPGGDGKLHQIFTPLPRMGPPEWLRKSMQASDRFIGIPTRANRAAPTPGEEPSK